MLLALLDTWDTHIHTWAAGLGWPGEGLFRLVVAVVAGGLVGLDREIRGRQAGFRTNILVCLGSALVMVVSTHFASVKWDHEPGVNVNVDPSRIAYGVMTGIGFLGAGTILHDRGAVRGLTTAAALWCVAAIGLAVGFGMYIHTAFAVVLVVLVLGLLDVVERRVPRLHYRLLTVRTAYAPGCALAACEKLNQKGVRARNVGFDRTVSDPSRIDIHLELTFLKPSEYTELERNIEQDGKYELIGAREVSV